MRNAKKRPIDHSLLPSKLEMKVLNRYFDSETGVKKELVKKKSKSNSIFFETSLHKALKLYPSASQIIPIVQMSNAINYPSIATRRRDSHGKLALHVACENGAYPETIAFLIREDKSACNIPDLEGKFPIHHLCENYVRNSDQSLTLDEAQENFLEILEMILESSNSSLLKLDCHGMCCIEHAINANLDYDIIYSLQKATEILMKSIERKSHQILCQDGKTSR